MSATVGLDLGGTKIYGVLAEGERIVAKTKMPTPAGRSEVLDALAAVVGELAPPGEVAAVGVGTPGAVDTVTGTVLHAPNLTGWDQPVTVSDELRDRLCGTPVAVTNDVNAAVLGEAEAGAIAGARDAVAVWLGTGVGGGLLLDGEIRSGPNGLAGEIGHVVVRPGGRRCGCGGRGHLEAYAGRRHLEAMARERHAGGEATALVDEAGDGPMKSKVWARSVEAGDPVACELIDDALALVGQVVSSVVLIADVTHVVVGGGLGVRLGDRAREALRSSLSASLFTGADIAVAVTDLGDRAGALGAARLARRLIA